MFGGAAVDALNVTAPLLSTAINVRALWILVCSFENSHIEFGEYFVFFAIEPEKLRPFWGLLQLERISVSTLACQQGYRS